MRKKIILLFVAFATYIQPANAQFLGGGTGTESDPYRIYNIEHWNQFTTEYNDPQSIYGDFSGMHLRLMNDIADTIRDCMIGLVEIPDIPVYKSFNGNLHGGGHALIIPPSNINGISYPHYFWGSVGVNGVIDSIDFRGALDSYGIRNVIGTNYGKISHCSMNFDCSHYVENDMFWGIAEVNFETGIIEYVSNYTKLLMGGFTGICCDNYGLVSHCINYADFPEKSNGNISAGILFQNYPPGTVEYSMNVGDMLGVEFVIAGLVVMNYNQISHIYDSINMQWISDTAKAVVQNCINLGNLVAEETNYEMKATLVGESEGIVRNCLDVGNASGFQVNVNNNDTIPIGTTLFLGNSYIMENCLVVGNTGPLCHYPFLGNNPDFANAIFRNNYYDKQMRTRTDSVIEGQVESRLTSQLVGDTPELRAMLGEGWSYAEGRYPIPLGFENDSIVLRAATPIFLHAESDDDYEHIDSVASNFTVSTANGASWSTVAHNVEISGENATLRYVGGETLKTRYSNLYEKQIRLNIVNVPVVTETIDLQDIDIFPNPVTDILNITSSETISEIEIVNVMGQVVKRMEVNADNVVCDVEDLKAGVYVVKVARITGEVEDLKLVKK